MQLTITAPDAQLRTGIVTKVTIPTELWEITVLPWHQPLISVLKAWMIAITPAQLPSVDEWFTVVEGKIVMSLTKWLVSIGDDTIVITTSVAVANVQATQEVLEKMREDMQAKIAKIKEDGNENELEEAIENMEKITADLRMAKIAHAR